MRHLHPLTMPSRTLAAIATLYFPAEVCRRWTSRLLVKAPGDRRNYRVARLFARWTILAGTRGLCCID